MQTKKHRLPPEAYFGAKCVAVTACLRHRRRLFTDDEVVARFVEGLRHWSSKKGCIVPVYCFMPDHLHLLMRGLDEHSRPKEAMDEFKESSGTWLAKHRPAFHWQKNYHDHIIRITEDWRSHVDYVVLNPVRWGLVQDPFDYPFTGSIGCRLEDVVFER